MLDKDQLSELKYQPRHVIPAVDEDAENLGPLDKLAGRWTNPNDETSFFRGRGWNMIALPFGGEPGDFNYRMLVNQYNEVLEFSDAIGPVPNRGLNGPADVATDQTIFALDYQQAINQIAVDDSSPTTGEDIVFPPGAGIHHEPGFFLHILDERTDKLDIARLATIPHGNSVAAMGRSSCIDGAPTIDPVPALPIGATPDGSDPELSDQGYFAPYEAFAGAKAFGGVVGIPLFDVTKPHELLQRAIDDLNVKRTTILHLDTKLGTGGIVNTPFVVNQADTTEMTSTFFIMELEPDSPGGEAGMALAYIQMVMLEFFPRRDGVEGLIKWPHVSINTMVFDKPLTALRMAQPSA
ncbi:MAG: heme-binding protein [Pseudomonadota bacterium]